MARDNIQNTDKNRKSEAQERFEQADNAGRFAGNDSDAKAARQQAEEAIRQDNSSSSSERNKRGTAQAQDTAGDAQNEEVDGSGRLEGKESEEARNKATEGIRQGRQDS
jgi:hypothetical protein